mmetsp:Transcript_34174/g.109730  ORF Transcript_34174/g.109730 Transcript_34174/m.109730 type:complete len:395 (-) Transcript_34174:218-1402(-)
MKGGKEVMPKFQPLRVGSASAAALEEQRKEVMNYVSKRNPHCNRQHQQQGMPEKKDLPSRSRSSSSSSSSSSSDESTEAEARAPEGSLPGRGRAVSSGLSPMEEDEGQPPPVRSSIRKSAGTAAESEEEASAPAADNHEENHEEEASDRSDDARSTAPKPGCRNGAIDLTLKSRADAVHFNAIPVPGDVAPDGRGYVPYATNELNCRSLGDRQCLREAFVVATGMQLGELGLEKKNIAAARRELVFDDGGPDLSIGTVLAALRKAKSPFELRRQDVGQTWPPLLSRRCGVFLVCVRMDNGDGHVVVFDAERWLLFLAWSKDGRNNVGHALLIEDDDCVDHESTKKKFKEKYGIVAPTFVYKVVVQKKRRWETLYFRTRRPGEKLGRTKKAPRSR